ncbi:MAG: carboxyl transferase domain-containing protein, partial [Chloroflexota bacterium]
MRELEKKVQEFRERKARFTRGGPEEDVQKQHQRGKLTARERLELLFDPKTFVEFNLLVTSPSTDFGLDKVETHGDGCISGWGRISGRKVLAFAQDFTIAGGSWGDMGVRKQIRTMQQAMEWQVPIVFMNDSGGIRPQEQHYNAPQGQGEHFFLWSTLSGVVPQLSLVMGPVAGGPCYGPPLTDFIFMVKGTSSMFIGGPSVVKALIGENVTEQELGGGEMHARVSGVASLLAEDDRECITRAKELLAFLPQNNTEEPPRVDTGDDPERVDPDLWQVLPDNPNGPY